MSNPILQSTQLTCTNTLKAIGLISEALLTVNALTCLHINDGTSNSPQCEAANNIWSALYELRKVHMQNVEKEVLAISKKITSHE